MNNSNLTVRANQPSTAAASPARVNSRDLLMQARTIQIEHEGKIYELRVTRQNKLILTA